MRYSLSNRFRGGLVGAAVGEIVGLHYQRQQKVDWARFDQIVQAAPARFREEANQPVPWGQMAVAQADQLRQSDRIFSSKLPDLQKMARSAIAAQSAGWAIAALPIALYFHEDFEQLHRQLQQRLGSVTSSADPSAPPPHPLDPATATIASAFSFLASSILREEFNPQQAIAPLIALPELQDAEHLKSSLAQLQSLLAQNTTLAIAAATLSSRPPSSPHSNSDCYQPFLQALYGFLYTPEDFRLTLARSVQMGSASPLTGAIAGALSGLWNGWTGIPLDWRMAIDHSASGSTVLQQSWGVSSLTSLENLANQLLWDWSGVYQQPPSSSVDFAVAAPDVIRPR